MQDGERGRTAGLLVAVLRLGYTQPGLLRGEGDLVVMDREPGDCARDGWCMVVVAVHLVAVGWAQSKERALCCRGCCWVRPEMA